MDLQLRSPLPGMRSGYDVTEEGAVSAQRAAVAFHATRARALACRDNYDGALVCYYAALALQPQEAYLYYCRGNAWSKKGNVEAALRDYSTALALAPEKVLYRYARACAALARNDSLQPAPGGG